MNSEKEAKLSMYIKVQQFLLEKLAALTLLFSIITDYKTDLDDFIQDILDADALATADTTGYTEAKRDQMTKLALRISGAGAAYYKGQGDSGKQNEIYFTKTEFVAAHDSVAYTYAMQVYALANPVGAALAPHGIVVGDISNLSLYAQQYLAILQLPKRKVSAKAAQGKKVDELMSETDDFLNETLDPQMRVMNGTDNQELYDEYLGNRGIDDAGGSSDSAGYDVIEVTVPAGGSVIFPIGAPGIPADLELYLRAISGSAFICSTNLPASPCAGGYEMLEGVTFKGIITPLGLDLTKTHIQFTNPGLTDAVVKAGTKSE